MSEITVANNQGQQRYELKLAGRVVGFATYRLAGSAVILTHTEIEAGHEGQGLGSRLVRAVLDDIRAQGKSVVPKCPFVTSYIRGHREYIDLVQPE